eukprot:2951063-Amphidinium_carterae.1
MQNGRALGCAAEEYKADRAVVLAAVMQNGYAMQFASDELLLESTFAPKAKQCYYILKVSMLSGRCTVVCACDQENTEAIVKECCGRLGMDRSGKEALVHGTE